MLAVLAGLMAWRGGRLQPGPPAPLIIGVMTVETRPKGEVPSWMAELTRDSLNTILGKFPPIKVFSRQKIEFVREKRGFPNTDFGDLEAAEQLGMQKMLSAFIVAGKEGDVTIRLEIVDVETGLQQATEYVTGSSKDLMDLENDLAVRALRALGVDPTPEQLAVVMESRGDTSLEVYKRFNEAFDSDASVDAAPPPRAPESKPRNDKIDVPTDKERTSWLSFPSEAWAGDNTDDAAIRYLIARYAAAMNKRDINQVLAVYPGMPAELKERLQNFFGSVSDLQVSITVTDILLSLDPNEALVDFTRDDQFVDIATRRREKNPGVLASARVERQGDGTWVITKLGK